MEQCGIDTPAGELFRPLQLAKYNVQGLAIRDHLRRDYKQYAGPVPREQYGIASVYTDAAGMASHDSFEADTAAYIEECGIRFILIMCTTQVDGGDAR